MAIKGTQVIGHKIISLHEGREIGKVQDLIYDPDEKKIAAVIVKKGGLFSDPKLILISDIKSIGEDAVVIDNQNMIKNSSQAGEKISSIAKNDTYITHTKIITNTGQELGTISDLLFNPSTGYVEKFEVSQGSLKDIRSGKKYIDISQIETIGQDVIIVKPQAVETIKQQEQNQGLQGAVNENKDKAKSLFEDTKENAAKTFNETQENIQPTLESAKNQAGDIVDTAKSKISEIQGNLEDKRKQDAIGRYLTINILTPNDEVVAKRGDMITHKLIQQAEKYGLLSQVLNNNSEKPINNAY